MDLKQVVLAIISTCLLVIGPTPAPISASASAQSHQSKPSLISVQTTSGLVQGIKWTATNGASKQPVYKFLSVPYAQAPIDRLRFKRPVEFGPERATDGTIVDATKFGKTCPQYRHLARFISPLLNLDHEHEISEDCLSLSIYVPASVAQTAADSADNGTTLEPSGQAPVIVWIPGEGFDFADARQFDGSHLAQRAQAIVVSVQYRVGILGFMAAPQLNITGNMGVYDQLAALRWIKRNIGSFGGDSERVTLMGRFSGSMAISSLLTAPEQSLVKLDANQALFNRAIMLSGLAVGDWIIERGTGLASKVDAIGELALERKYCTRAQLKSGSCLQDMPIERLLQISGYGWKLAVDNELIGPLDPIEAIRADPSRLAAGVDAILLGETDTEGTLCLYRHALDSSTNFAQLIEDNRLTPADLYELLRDDARAYFQYNISQSNPIRMALETISGAELASEQTGDNQLRAKYLDACSSYMVKSHNGEFKRHVEARNRLAERTSDKKPVELYHYSLKYKPSFSLAPDYIKTAAHGDDVPLIFGLVYNQARHSISQADLLMTQQMMSYIGNFVHGNHPLLQQHNSIDYLSSGANETFEGTGGEQESPLRPLATGHEPARQLGSWATVRANQVHSIDLTQDDYDELSGVGGGDSTPRARAKQADTNADSTRDKDSIKLAQLQQQSIAKQQPIGTELLRANQLKVVLVDGQQVVAIATNGPSEFDARPAESRQQPSADEQTHSLTRSQRLLDLHTRQQLLERASPSWQLARSGQLVVPTEGARQPAATSTSTSSNTTNMLASELSIVSALLLSSCIIIFVMMSICVGLSVVIIRCHNYPATSGGQSVQAARLSAPSLRNPKRNSQHFNSCSPACNICDDLHLNPNNMDAVLAGSNKKADERAFCNVFAKLRNQHQVRAQAGSESATISVHAAAAGQTNQSTGDLILHQQADPTETNRQCNRQL